MTIDLHRRNAIKRDRRRIFWPLRAFALLSAVLAASIPYAARAITAEGAVFASPERAATALASAWQNDDSAALVGIFGPAGKELVESGDPVADKEARKKLASSYAEAHRLETVDPQKIVIILGKDEWPYPIPLVRQGAKWLFDVKDGAEQIIDRRIGRNELNVIEVCRTYVDAQREYARLNEHPHEYALKFASSDGKHDGLYWQTPAGGPESPLGPFVARAESEGYGRVSAEGRAPFQGYFYRILTRQGKDAPGGAKDYTVSGHMTGGFALIAFPANYGNSGVMTFMVNQHGIVFEKNLGPATDDTARQIKEYDPDKTWKIATP